MNELIITTSQRLKDYAIWYYFKYLPSTKRLENKLLEKTKNNRELVDQVLNDVKHLFQEKEIIESKVKIYLFRNKNLAYIKGKLREKLFNQNLINEILEQNIIEWESLFSENYLLKKIENYKQKWKSKKYIYQKLVERTEDKEIVENCLNQVFWDDLENEILKLEFEKLKGKYDNNKIIEKLIRKGFDYRQIKNLLL